MHQQCQKSRNSDVDENVLNGTDVGVVTANDTDLVVDRWQNLTFYMDDETGTYQL